MSNYKNKGLKGGLNSDSILTLPDPVLDEKGPCKEDAFIRQFGFKIELRDKGVLWTKDGHLYTQDEALAVAHKEHRIKQNMNEAEKGVK